LDASFLVAILPNIEQTNLYNSINHSTSILGPENRSSYAVSVGAFSCPSDPGSGVARIGYPLERLAEDNSVFNQPMLVSFTSYAGCVGSRGGGAFPDPNNQCRVNAVELNEVNGCINNISPMPLSAIRDGLSHTMIVSEKATCKFRELDAPKDRFFETCGSWFRGSETDTQFSADHPPNCFRLFPVTSSLLRITTASSLHPGGINVLLGDGSVRFVKETIQSTKRPYIDPAGVWQALATRDGGESYDDSTY
jgi:prepilin-type processing-associated H-X9-DG protein